MKSFSYLPALIVLASLVVLNLVPDAGLWPFEGQGVGGGFGASRGWPLAAIAPADEVGSGYIRASVVQGDITAYENVRSGRYSHLALSWFSVIADLLFGLTCVGLAWFIPRFLIGRKRISMTKRPL